MRLRTIMYLVLVGLTPFSGPISSAVAQGMRNQAAAATTGPQLYSSRNFQMVTDLDEEEAEALLERLETMLDLVSGYFGQRNTKPIDMYVADDISNWPESVLEQMDENGLASIRSGGGLTITQVISNGQQFDSKAVVYATSQRGTPQHEAVHAYCGHAFGRTGPVWYGEGMAEVGNYWLENDKSVNAEPYVIEYLQSSEIRPLADIVNNPLEQTGDSWENYAWRWALCHLLGFNENYTDRFKPLGLQLLQGNDIDFWEVYGTHAPEIEFEYRQFLTDLERGYRCDLCSWDWRTRFRALRGSAAATARIQAARGWQGSRLTVAEGTEYAFEAEGEWSLGTEKELVTAAGDETGAGRLVAVVQFQDSDGTYQISEPFELGESGTFVAPAAGNLYVRCQDAWGSIADNRGQVNVQLKLAE